MAKIATAHIEIKPTFDRGAFEVALEGLGQVVEDVVAAAVHSGIQRGIEQGKDSQTDAMKASVDAKIFDQDGVL